jgi:riboflavin kinase/FMN adenylyltransferase
MTSPSGAMTLVLGLDELDASLGRLFVVVGVFDGLHRGHQYLLDQLAVQAEHLGATPAVLTFDHHPDEVLTGTAPPLLCDPQERLDRLSAAGVGVTIVQHFDVALRETPYDAFVRRIADRVDVAGFLMTPDSAFGFERRGTPDTVAALGAELGYEVVVVPPFELDGRAVSSSEIRRAIGAGDLSAAERLLGRPVAVTGAVEPDAASGARLAFDLPVMLPPDGRYPVRIEPAAATGAVGESGEAAAAAAEQALAAIEGQRVGLIGSVEPGRRVRLTFA